MLCSVMLITLGEDGEEGWTYRAGNSWGMGRRVGRIIAGRMGRRVGRIELVIAGGGWGGGLDV